jgi:hypothetical protein
MVLTFNLGSLSDKRKQMHSNFFRFEKKEKKKAKKKPG